MKWPWVSRKELERVEKQLEDVDKERRTLLGLLLERADTVTAPKVTPSVEEDHSREPVPYTTPFDRIVNRFDQAGKGARKPEFKARMR